MNQNDFLKHVQSYVANIAIGASTLRKVGAKGVVGAARGFLANLNLTPLKGMLPDRYGTWLNEQTRRLMAHFPKPARKWGAARKALNIFLCHAYLNRFLCEAYKLVRFEHVMETPLDRVVATKLRDKAPNDLLPSWPGVGRLKSRVSQKYQAFAAEYAKQRGVPRGCLDVVLWERVPVEE